MHPKGIEAFPSYIALTAGTLTSSGDKHMPFKNLHATCLTYLGTSMFLSKICTKSILQMFLDVTCVWQFSLPDFGKKNTDSRIDELRLDWP